ncbi:MAG: ATP-binding protein [Planctomycetaceae bacterium]|nr:ATP-binding protein [Planctomycetaceae bacterium]
MKHWKFFSTLLVVNLLLIAAVFFVGFFVTLGKVKQRTDRLTGQFQSQFLTVVRHDLEESWPSVESRIHLYCHSDLHPLGFRLTIIDLQGRVLGDSEYPEEKTEPHNTGDRPEVVEALTGRQGQAIRTSQTNRVDYRYFAEPILHEGEVVAVVRVAVPVASLVESHRHIVSGVLTGFALMLFVAVVLSVLFSWIWHRPLRQINRMVRNISRGNLGDIALVSGPHEITELAKNIDRMRRTVASQLATITRQQEQFRVILHYLPDAVFAINSEDDVLYCNESAKKLFGIESPERPQHIQRLIRHAGILDFYFRESKRLRTTAADTTLERLELELQGQRRVLDLELLEVPDGSDTDKITILLVISDVTALFRIGQMKVDFVANASHELRNPLATIRAALDNINDGVYDNSESLQTVFQVLNRHVARLETLIEDLLSLQSVEDKFTQLQLEQTSSEEQRFWLDELFRKKADERDVSLTFDLEENMPPFVTDNKRLGLILQNLVDNAIKFTPGGGKVIVRFARAGDSQLVITCNDTGCGIAPHEQDRVFERFYQSNASRTGDSRIRGTGLGLAIVKHAVERMNGTITLTSRLRFGTTMTVRVPVEFV